MEDTAGEHWEEFSKRYHEAMYDVAMTIVRQETEAVSRGGEETVLVRDLVTRLGGVSLQEAALKMIYITQSGRAGVKQQIAKDAADRWTVVARALDGTVSEWLQAMAPRVEFAGAVLTKSATKI